MHRFPFLLVLALSLAACDSDDVSPTATASISAPADTTTGVTGTVRLTQNGLESLEMKVELSGLAPNSTHGFHVHTVGDCGRGDHDDDGFAEVGGAALGHYDPLDTNDHGAPDDSPGEKHLGDLGNVTADAQGRVSTTITTSDLSIESSRTIEGRAVMVHSNRDDLESDPGGMSGDRIGCGVISMATDSDSDDE